MNLKTSKNLAIETFTNVANSYDLELLGCPSPYDSSKNSFLAIYGKDSKFFYRAQKLKNNIVTKYEVGIGYLENNILKRNPLYHGLSDNAVPSVNGPQYFVADSDEILLVTSHIPSNHNELLCDPHCVITSLDSHLPHPVHLQNHSLLGRMDDIIQSIPLSDIFSHPQLISAILEVIVTYSKQLSLKTPKLDAKRLCTDSLQLNSNNKPLEKAGSLVFDGENLKFYDGQEWKRIKFE